MQDGKALQAGTSHYLGTNFSEAANIKFLNKEGEHVLGHTTSWGVSTRLIGALIMTHSDDDGLRLPPKIAPKQAVILPVIPKEKHREEVLKYASLVSEKLSGTNISFTTDNRDIRGGDKKWQWVKKGIPLILEIGPRDIESNNVMLARRDTGEKIKVSIDNLQNTCAELLEEIQNNYFKQAKTRLESNTVKDISNLEEFKNYFSKNTGFVQAPWSEDEKEVEKILKPLKITVRCLPRGVEAKGNCIFTSKPAKSVAIFAKAY